MSMNLTKLAKKIVQDNRDKKTQKVRLDFIILNLILSVFFIYLLVLPSLFLLSKICPPTLPDLTEIILTKKQKSPILRALCSVNSC